VLGGFISDLQAGKSAAEALSNALQKIASKLLDKGLNALFGLGGSGGGIFGGGGGLLGGSIIPGILSTSASPSPIAPIVNKAISAPAMLSQSVSAAGGRGKNADAVHVTVGVSADNNGNLMPFVESVSRKNIRQAAPSLVKASVQQVKGKMPSLMADAQARNL